ncbi:hypothetical protein KY362_06525 [Candidatus Woesearchaeota archaeon]|nr:hypothetical protein [Candidatus Woesearchaeota archaeon]
MLGNITLVMPLEKLYNSTFQKQWDRTLDKIRLTSPGDLEELEKHVRKLEKLYEFSGVKKLSVSLGTYPDEYSRRINMLRSGMCDSIQRKFESMAQQIRRTLADWDRLDDYDSDRHEFDDAMVQFSLLRAFYKRWRLATPQYRSTGSSYDFTRNIKEIAYMLARKRTLLMNEYASRKRGIEHRQRTDALRGVSEEVGRSLDWYKLHYLNTDWNNSSWSGLETGGPWMKVDYLDAGNCIAPLELLRKVPSEPELQDLDRLFNKFAGFYSKHSLIDIQELGVLFNYEYLQDYAQNFSAESEDPAEQLKAGLMQQMLMLHRMVDDARKRRQFKQEKEKEYKTSFAMYFAPIDEIYGILQKGYICSEHSVHSKVNRHRHNSLLFHINADIRDGDVGFIFPLTKVLEGHIFYELSDHRDCGDDTNNQLHVLNRNTAHPVRVDIRNGVFIAPKNRIVRYSVGGQQVSETSEDYFRRFFTALAAQGSDWFDSSRLHNWLSRHCVFYDDKSRAGLLNVLRDRRFVNIMNSFTNKNFDNLSLAPVDGQLMLSDFYVQHRFDDVPEEMLPGSREVNLSLFEWVNPEQ